MSAGTLQLADIVKRSTDLPTLPEAALAVMRETDNSASSARTVAVHLARDQALSVRVLRLSNSAYYGLQRQVLDLQEAVVLLGMRAVRNLAVVASTYPWMNRPLTGYCLEPKAMWRHSFGVGVASQLVAKRSGAADPELVFPCGLLHNIGKVAMSVWLDKKLGAMMALAQRDDLAFDEVERKLLGYDHTEVGAYLAEQWNLPEMMTKVIRYHHRPNDLQPTDPVVDIVHVADYMTMTLGFGLGGDGMRYDFFPDTLERLRIKQDDIDEMTAEFVDLYEAYSKALEEMMGE